MNLLRSIKPTVSLTGLMTSPDVQRQLENLIGTVKTVASPAGATTLLLTGSSADSAAAASAVAHETGRQLLRVDLSAVVSKYIGETEKNLDRVFTEADPAGVILLFDEADSLFGKRSDVKDSHDKYANVEIAYLQQKMESFSGVVIFATQMAVDPSPKGLFRYVVKLPPK